MYKDKICPVCGTKFSPKNARQTYCSVTCKNINQKSREDAKKQEIQKKCEWCGKLFHPRTNTQKYCDDIHYQKCEICGKSFEINLRKQDKPRTCSKDCSYRLRFKQGNPFSRPESREKARRTMIERYGVEHPMYSEEFIGKMKQTYEKNTGFSSPFENPEVRSKMAQSAKHSGLENRICQLFDEYGIKYVRHTMVVKDNLSHEFDFYLPKLNLYIDADGLFYHSYLDDPNGKQVLDYYDEDRLALIPEGAQFYLIVEGQEDKCVAELSKMIHSEMSISERDTEIFKWCRSIEFPYPNYTQRRMTKDWKRLCNYTCDKYVPQARLGDSIIRNYHKSIYSAKVGNCVSPIDGWYDDEKLAKVIKNRLIYVNDVDPSKVLTGFNVSKICPKVSVFNPVLARYLTLKYLSECLEVIDPFSGWSGRMLGVCSTGKRYIGYDLNNYAVEESMQIKALLNLDAELHCENSLNITGAASGLLTCPPYGKKEIYNQETEFHSCDEWIDLILDRFVCDKYVFVVDETVKYKDNIVEKIASTSHFNTTKEYVILL